MEGEECGTRDVLGIRRGFGIEKGQMAYSAMFAIATREYEGTIRAPSAVREKATAAERLVRPSKEIFSSSSSSS